MIFCYGLNIAVFRLPILWPSCKVYCSYQGITGLSSYSFHLARYGSFYARCRVQTHITSSFNIPFNKPWVLDKANLQRMHYRSAVAMPCLYHSFRTPCLYIIHFHLEHIAFISFIQITLPLYHLFRTHCLYIIHSEHIAFISFIQNTLLITIIYFRILTERAKLLRVVITIHFKKKIFKFHWIKQLKQILSLVVYFRFRTYMLSFFVVVFDPKITETFILDNVHIISCLLKTINFLSTLL
jgi:hypothetical protein